jgi:cob(I)alamin adenosyltransferase
MANRRKLVRHSHFNEMSIATKTGDSGETSLMYGRRVPKTDSRVAAYGAVDELNAALGLARATNAEPWTGNQIEKLQKELITLMGELATAEEDLERYARDGFQLTSAAMVDGLTSLVHEIEKEKLPPSKGWATPGATLGAATLDVARTTCRRAERAVAAIAPRNGEILRYLNRLSDLLWLLARCAEQPTETRNQA